MKTGSELLFELADFIGQLPNRKVNMNSYGSNPNKKVLDPINCKSAGCALGWAAVKFPKLFRLSWEKDYDNEVYIATVYLRKWDPNDWPVHSVKAAAMAFDMSDETAGIMFGAARSKYHTAKQVAKGLRSYAKTGIIPNECLED